MSLDLKSIGDKVKRSREQLLLSASEVEQSTGIPVDRISLIERGELEPTGDEILIFADFFKQDYTFFISNQKLSASEQVDILYRRFENEFSKSDRKIVQEFLFLCECEQFIWNELKLEIPKFDFIPTGNYYKKHGEAGAISFRQFLGYEGNQLIKDFYFELRRTGIHIFRRKLTNSRISGLFISHPYAGKCILVNYDEDIFRQNFTLLHEVGHSVFDYTEKINVSFQSDFGNRDLIELRANSFASNFLVPKEILRNLKITQWNREVITRLCVQFKVNVMTLLISLKEAQLLNETFFEEYKSLKLPKSDKEDPELKNVSSKIKEGKISLLERGLSTFYISKCYDAYSQGIITERRFAEMLLTNENDLLKILEQFSFKLRYGN